MLEYNIAGQIDDRNFIEMNKQITDESSEIYSAIQEIEYEINSRSEYKQKIEEIRNILLKAENEASQNMIDSAFINRYIDKIYVTPIEEGTVEISVKIFSGETVEKHLSTLRKRHKSIKNAEKTDENGASDNGIVDIGSTGHTFKEKFSDREGDDVHRNDTMQEIVSLSERFGIHVTFSKPNKETFLHIVHHLADENGIEMPTDEINGLASVLHWNVAADLQDLLNSL